MQSLQIASNYRISATSIWEGCGGKYVAAYLQVLHRKCLQTLKKSMTKIRNNESLDRNSNLIPSEYKIGMVCTTAGEGNYFY